MGRNLISIILLLVPFYIKGQTVFFDHYGHEEGLNDLRITELLQDDQGFLWIATLNGLFRYDGRSFDEIHFADENTGKSVYDIYYDNNRVLWIAGNKGVYAFNGTDFSFFGLDNTDQGKYCDHFIDGQDKSMGFFYDHTFYRIADNTIQVVENFPADITREIRDTYRSESGITWILTSGGNVYSINKDNISGPYEISLLADHFYTLRGLGKDELAISTNRGIIKIPVNGQEILKIDWMIDKGNIQDFYRQSDQSLWVLSENKVLNITHVDTLEAGIDIQQPERSILLADYEKNIWVSEWGKGLYRIPGNELARFQGENTKEHTPTSFLMDDDKLWISYFGAGVKVHGRDSPANSVNMLPSNYVRTIEKTENTFWFATAKGLIRKGENTIETYTDKNGLPHNYCYFLLSDSLGNIWVSTEGGLGIIEGRSITTLTTEDGLSENRVSYMKELAEGKMLLLSERNIDLYDNGRIKPFLRHPFRSKENLNTICRDGFGNFWIGSDMYGLIHYQYHEDKLNYISEEGRMDFSRVRAIERIGQNQLCLGTEKGLFIITINEQGQILEARILGLNTGYPDFEVNHNAIKKFGDKIFCGTNIGTVVFYPYGPSRRPEGPKVRMTGMDVSLRETNWQNKKFRLDPWSRMPVNPVMEHDNNDLRFIFNSISLGSDGRTWYRYKLDDHDRSWSSPTTDNSVIYANLRPGSYLFNIQASYDGINWNSNHETYSFIIAPPFWNTWWFIIIVIAFLLLGFVFFNNYRIKLKVNQLMALERLRKEEYGRLQKKVAMDFHDEVGNHLTSISLLVNLIKSEDWQIPPKLRDLLDKIDLESNNLFNGTRDFIWSIDPGNNNLKTMFNYIRDYGVELFENSAIQFHAKNGQDIDNINLPPGFTRQIVLIFKEGIKNALLHAGCKNVYFKMLLNKKDFEIRLVDDGKGFNADELDYYEGLKKMKYRGAKIRSELKVSSNENKGTEIILIANYN